MRLRNRVRVFSRFVVLAVCAALAVLVQVPVRPVQAQAQAGPRYVTFDFPNATMTMAFGEVQPGVIMGWFRDANWKPHSYLRYSNGQFVTIDVPGGAGITAVNGANIWGAISGVYTDGNMVRHGLLRTLDGRFILIDVKAAGPSAGQGTWAPNINVLGQIAGVYADAANVEHAFIRSPSGWITTFDAPGAGTAAYQGTATNRWSLNARGEFSGFYIDASGVWHGFLRFPDGQITTFDDPLAGNDGSTGQGTEPEAINNLGTIVGLYQDANNVLHGFLRTRDGTFTNFDDPEANAGEAWTGTYAFDINELGEVVGGYYNADWIAHGFLRTPLGKFITIDPPGSDATDISSITSSGVIVGSYLDHATQKYRGFLCYPGAWWNQ